MRPDIQAQLDRCVFADTSKIDGNNDAYIIPRYSKPSYDLGKAYIVQIKQVAMQPHYVTNVNWNNGACPISDVLKIFVSKTLSNMIFVDSIVYNLQAQKEENRFWSGWLNVDSIDLIAEVK